KVVRAAPRDDLLDERRVSDAELVQQVAQVALGGRAVLGGIARARAREHLVVQTNARPPLGPLHRVGSDREPVAAELGGDHRVVHPKQGVPRIEEDGANREVCGRHARPRSSIARAIRYTSPVLALGLVARWIHLASSIFLVGGAVMLAMAGAD